jgi:outer membrane protein OmpA-like peptidoglycan-associated protein
MKKLILKESQIKKIVKMLISEQSNNIESWRLCGYDIIKENGAFYCENNRGEMVKLPFASELSGIIQNGEIAFDDDIFNGLELGQDMRASVCSNKYPMQYAGASTGGRGGSWFLVIDDLSKQHSEPTPIYTIFTWNGSLRVGGGNYPDLKVLKEKEGIEIKYQVTRTKNFILELSPAMAGSKNRPSDVPPPVKKPEFEEIKLDIQSPFEFDKVTLTPEAENEFKKFVEKIKINYQGVSGDVEIIASASIDADEDQKRDYNQKLSDNRASTIANRLKAETGITTLNFIPKGIGQTDQFARGMKYPEVRDTSKTAPNRRLIIKMPTLTKEKK